MNIIIKGKIFAVSKKEFEGNLTEKAQFLNQDEKSGGAEIIEVKLIENGVVKANDQVQIPVKISTFNGKLFYSQIDKIIKS
jgi:hypothetical protein